MRHGETNYNVDGLVQSSDSVLTDRGREQAKQLAERVRHLSFQHVVVSDYVRTRETAEELLLHTDASVEYSALVREIRRPSEFWHQSNSSEAYVSFMQQATDKYADSEWHYSNEENFFDARSRVAEALDYFETLDGDVVVVTHSHFVRLLVSYVLLQGELEAADWKKMEHSYWAQNGGITTIVCDTESRRLLTFNDFAHFAE